MDMQWTRRAMVGAALSAAAPAVVNVVAAQDKAPAAPAKSAGAAAASSKGKLTFESMGALLKAMDLKATASELRYDFTFKSTIENAEWDLVMSTVLSEDGSTIWIMAWLDELPKSAADVPRTALLRLLSDNDKMGNGKFFAYIPANRRFVLQRVIPNDNVTAAVFHAALTDLGQSVVEKHADWYVANWASSTGEDPAAAARSGTQVKGGASQTSGQPATVRPAAQSTTGQAASPAGNQTVRPVNSQGAAAQTGRPVQSVVNDSKFNQATKK